MKQIRISVAVAAYNGERFLREQMDSICRNLGPEDEIVVSDDGSLDATAAILKEYQGGAIPLAVIKGPGRGIKQNINEALRHCRGQYIFLADQDDVWADNKVERVMRMLGKDGCRLVCHDAKVMDASLSHTLMPSFFAYRSSKAGFWNNLLKNRYMGCCMAFDAKLLRLVLPIPDEIQMHDQWIGMINDMTGGNSVFLREQLLLYRRHGANVSDFSHGSVRKMIAARMTLFCKLWQKKKLWKSF